MSNVKLPRNCCEIRKVKVFIMDKNYPKISIITPSYNQGNFIEVAIQSVIKQCYRNFEHIIIDNSSTDKTTEILQKYQHLIWKSEPDKGQSDALNQGFHLATGDIIGWLNADDKYLPGCFQTISNHFNEHAESDIAYGNYRWVNAEGEVFQSRRELDFDIFTLKYLHVLAIHSTSTFFRRKIFDEENYLDISLKYAMDYEFFLRLAMKNYKFTHINSYLADFRWHVDSKSSIGAKEQSREKEMALLRHDSFLKNVPKPVRLPVRDFLKLIARGKRSLFKGFRGYYFDQWKKDAL